LAELTQPFDQPDVSYFRPLLAQVEQRLGFKPRFGALDAAFDAFYVYEYFHPKLRNQASITNQNSLTYILINLHALQRIRQRLAERGQAITA